MTTDTAEKPVKAPRSTKAKSTPAREPQGPAPADAQTTILEATTDEAKLSQVEVYNPIEKGIALMLEKHGFMLSKPPVINGDQTVFDRVKEGRQEMVKFRTGLEKVRKAEKAEALEYCNLVDSEARRIQTIATPIEEAYDAVLEAEEKRLEKIREEERLREQKRVADLQKRIQDIKDVRDTATLCRTAARVQELIDGMPDHLKETFQEFKEDAQVAYDQTMALLKELHATRLASEQAAALLAAQQAELALQQAALAAEQAETARKAAITAKLDVIKEMRFEAATAATAADVQALLDKLGTLVPDDSFGDSKDDALALWTATKTAVTLVHTNKVASELLAAQLATQAAQQEETQARLAQAEAPVAAPTEAPAGAADSAPLEQTEDAGPVFEDKAGSPVATPSRQYGGGYSGSYHGGSFMRSPAAAPAPQKARRFNNSCELDRPDDLQVITFLSEGFDATPLEVVAWLQDMDLTDTDALLGLKTVVNG